MDYDDYPWNGGSRMGTALERRLQKRMDLEQDFTRDEELSELDRLDWIESTSRIDATNRRRPSPSKITHEDDDDDDVKFIYCVSGGNKLTTPSGHNFQFSPLKIDVITKRESVSDDHDSSGPGSTESPTNKNHAKANGLPFQIQKDGGYSSQSSSYSTTSPVNSEEDSKHWFLSKRHNHTKKRNVSAMMAQESRDSTSVANDETLILEPKLSQSRKTDHDQHHRSGVETRPVCYDYHHGSNLNPKGVRLEEIPLPIGTPPASPLPTGAAPSAPVFGNSFSNNFQLQSMLNPMSYGYSQLPWMGQYQYPFYQYYASINPFQFPFPFPPPSFPPRNQAANNFTAPPPVLAPVPAPAPPLPSAPAPVPAPVPPLPSEAEAAPVPAPVLAPVAASGETIQNCNIAANSQSTSSNASCVTPQVDEPVEQEKQSESIRAVEPCSSSGPKEQQKTSEGFPATSTVSISAADSSPNGRCEERNPIPNAKGKRSFCNWIKDRREFDDEVVNETPSELELRRLAEPLSFTRRCGVERLYDQFSPGINVPGKSASKFMCIVVRCKEKAKTRDAIEEHIYEKHLRCDNGQRLNIYTLVQKQNTQGKRQVPSPTKSLLRDPRLQKKKSVANVRLMKCNFRGCEKEGSSSNIGSHIRDHLEKKFYCPHDLCHHMFYYKSHMLKHLVKDHDIVKKQKNDDYGQ